MQMDKYYKAKGYKRISLNKAQGLDDKIHHGMDGIYYNPNKNPKYIIAEAKFGTSKLDRKTKQMSDEWITEKSRNRLGIVDEKHRKEIKELLKKIAMKSEKIYFMLMKEVKKLLII
ncbi:hypothetical protein [Helicobacter trogontum]|uniref:Cytosolic protein n=1 Tax=Helicobacter trogontum TaxID=50960 RepID=A0ABQ0D318_9HELI|nr:hypothetical protein [Helicobacter trogontum]MCI5786379.1 hypothetical protein [Helicobacter trogontum]MDY5184544.1 hypothetical protein [Helicobacter trogontum]